MARLRNYIKVLDINFAAYLSVSSVTLENIFQTQQTNKHMHTRTHRYTQTRTHTHTVVKRQCSLMLTSLRLYWHRLLKQLLRLFLRESAVAVATEAPLVFFPKRQIVCVSKDAIFDARSLTVWEKVWQTRRKGRVCFSARWGKLFTLSESKYNITIWGLDVQHETNISISPVRKDLAIRLL